MYHRAFRPILHGIPCVAFPQISWAPSRATWTWFQVVPRHPPSSLTLSVANPTFSSIDFAIFICPTHNENCISLRDLLVLYSHITLSCQYRNLFSPRKLLKTERKSEHPSWPAPQEKIFYFSAAALAASFHATENHRSPISRWLHLHLLIAPSSKFLSITWRLFWGFPPSLNIPQIKSAPSSSLYSETVINKSFQLLLYDKHILSDIYDNADEAT